MACLQNGTCGIPGGKLLESVSSCFSSVVPRCVVFSPYAISRGSLSLFESTCQEFLKEKKKSSLSSLAHSGQTTSLMRQDPLIYVSPQQLIFLSDRLPVFY